VIVIKAKELKEVLDEDRIVMILEEIGCHHIKKKSNCVTAARPGGDNEESVCCRTDNDNYHCDIFTKTKFQLIKNRDILTLVGFLKGISFPQSLKFVCSLFDLDYYIDKESEVPKFLTWLDFVETGEMKDSDTKITPLPEIVLDQFFMGAVMKWYDEGITIEAMIHFECGIDIHSERLIFAIRDNVGALIGVKGRLLCDDKADGNKYMYLYSCGKSLLLYGLYQNYSEIIKAGEIIVVESEKQVIKLWGLGYKNAIAICGKSISETQVELILRCNVDVVLAFDKDVQEEEVFANVDKLNYPVKTQKIFVLQDPLNLLAEKESPCDNSDTWKCLYENFKVEI
jgi:DNA primase